MRDCRYCGGSGIDGMDGGQCPYCDGTGVENHDGSSKYDDEYEDEYEDDYEYFLDDDLEEDYQMCFDSKGNLCAELGLDCEFCPFSQKCV